MNIIFKSRRTDVQERFRGYASAKLGRIAKLDSRAIRVDVEVSAERNPRQSDRRERVELTIRSRGPAIRAEAAADDRFAALDRALAKLEERLRRSGDRRKAARHGALQAGRVPGQRGAPDLTEERTGAGPAALGNGAEPDYPAAGPGELDGTEGGVDQALLEMELVGHDFYLFRDEQCGLPSVVYRRHGYQYGLIRLVEQAGPDMAASGGRA